MVDKLLFEGDDTGNSKIYYQIKAFNGNKNRKNSEITVIEDFVLPNEVLKEMIRNPNTIFIKKFCICHVSPDCKDYTDELYVYSGKWCYKNIS